MNVLDTKIPRTKLPGRGALAGAHERTVAGHAAKHTSVLVTVVTQARGQKYPTDLRDRKCVTEVREADLRAAVKATMFAGMSREAQNQPLR